MKSRPKKQNYLVFLVFVRNRLSTGTFRRNPAGSSVLDHAHFLSAPCRYFTGLWRYVFPIRTDHIVQPLDLHQKVPLSHGPEDWGGVQ